jgi:hypothetical protein
MDVWRRFHGEHLCAHVSQEGGDYVVAVWHTASGELSKLQRTFRHLQAAQAAADHLVRRTFHHVCTTDACGTWLVWVM